jgi:hypothetical protein
MEKPSLTELGEKGCFALVLQDGVFFPYLMGPKSLRQKSHQVLWGTTAK